MFSMVSTFYTYAYRVRQKNGLSMFWTTSFGFGWIFNFWHKRNKM